VKNTSLSCTHFFESFPEASSKDIRSLANHPDYLPLTHILTGGQISQVQESMLGNSGKSRAFLGSFVNRAVAAV
jgi:hypothetical protein